MANLTDAERAELFDVPKEALSLRSYTLAGVALGVVPAHMVGRIAAIAGLEMAAIERNDFSFEHPSVATVLDRIFEGFSLEGRPQLFRQTLFLMLCTTMSMVIQGSADEVRRLADILAAQS